MAKKPWVKPAGYVKEDLAQKITDRIVALMEEGPGAWVAHFEKSAGGLLPCNGTTGKPYSGTNFIMLITAGFDDQRFYTHKQLSGIKSLNAPEGSKQGDPGWGCHVRKGEHGTPIIYAEKKSFSVKDGEGNVQRDQDGNDVTKSGFLTKSYTVFNASQIEGLPLVPGMVRNEAFVELERAETIVQALVVKTGLTVAHGGNQPYYSPSLDKVQMPLKEAFEPGHYYTVLMHEAAHSTLHPTRLDRKGLVPEGFDATINHENRAREELRAELASAMLAAQTGIPLSEEHLRNSASYLQSWIGALKNDKNEITNACSEARKICEYMLTKEAEHLKDLGIERPAPVEWAVVDGVVQKAPNVAAVLEETKLPESPVEAMKSDMVPTAKTTAPEAPRRAAPIHESPRRPVSAVATMSM